jgi:hypothetical protein
MDPQVFELARQLQAKLARIDERGDREIFESVHDLLIKLIDGIETAMPALRNKREKAEAKAALEETKRLLEEMRGEGNLPDDTDSLEQIENELEDEGPDHPCRCSRKAEAGPKGIDRWRCFAATGKRFKTVMNRYGYQRPLGRKDDTCQ